MKTSELLAYIFGGIAGIFLGLGIVVLVHHLNPSLPENPTTPTTGTFTAITNLPDRYAQGANDAIDTLALYDLERHMRAIDIQEAALKRDLKPGEALKVVEEAQDLWRPRNWGEYKEIMKQRLKLESK